MEWSGMEMAWNGMELREFFGTYCSWGGVNFAKCISHRRWWQMKSNVMCIRTLTKLNNVETVAVCSRTHAVKSKGPFQ